MFHCRLPSEYILLGAMLVNSLSDSKLPCAVTWETPIVIGYPRLEYADDLSVQCKLLRRSMLGDVVFNLPAGALEDKHMQAARLVLQQYDVLLILSSPPQDTQLGFTFGLAWQVSLVHAVIKVLCGVWFRVGTLG